jgi:peptidoglycan/LPS O-acetylase OafA/YrhL
VVVIAGIVLSVVVAGVFTRVIEAWHSRRRPRKSLLEHLQPYQPTSVADEAQRWLDQQQG